MTLKTSSFLLLVALSAMSALVGVTSESKDILAQQASPTSSVPVDLAPITLSNASQLRQLGMLGQGQIYHMTWLSDGKTLAVLSSVGVWLYDTDALDLAPRFLSMYTGLAYDQALNSDGTMLATVSVSIFDYSYSVRVWDTKAGAALFTLGGHTNHVERVVFSPDGNVLASGDASGVIRLWDMRTGKTLAVLQGHEDSITGLAFSSDGTLLASTSGGGTVRLWDVESGKELLTLKGQGPTILSVAFSPDGATLASWAMGSDRTLRLWDVHSGTQLWSLEGFFPYDGVAFEPGGEMLATGSLNGSVQLLRTNTGTEAAVLRNGGAPVYALKFSPDGGKLAAAHEDGSISLWNTQTASMLTVWQGYTFGVESATFSPDGTLLASGYANGTIRLWDLKTRTVRSLLAGHACPVVDVAFDPTGTELASAIEPSGRGLCEIPNWEADQPVFEKARLWDWRSGKEILAFGDHYMTSSVAFSPDGTLLAYPEAGATEDTLFGIRLWNMEKGEQGAFLLGHTESVTDVAFNPNGTLLASGSWDGTVRIWDVRSGKTLAVLRSNAGIDVYIAGGVERVLFSPDGTLLASANDDGTVRLWDVTQREQVAVLKTGGFRVYGIGFSPNGELLATSGAEDPGGIQLWDVVTGKKVVTLEGHNGIIYSVSFSPDGNLLVSSGEDGTVRLWGSS